MKYKIKYHPDALKDLKKIGHDISIKALKKIEQISENPLIGQRLGNLYGMDLTGYRKTYIVKKKFRIVYRVDNDIVTVFIIAIGPRDSLIVYQEAQKRITDIE